MKLAEDTYHILIGNRFADYWRGEENLLKTKSWLKYHYGSGITPREIRVFPKEDPQMETYLLPWHRIPEGSKRKPFTVTLPVAERKKTLAPMGLLEKEEKIRFGLN